MTSVSTAAVGANMAAAAAALLVVELLLPARRLLSQLTCEWCLAIKEPSHRDG